VPYHVRITTRSQPSHDELALDLTKAELKRRFLDPYNQGRPIVTGGRIIPPHDIQRIRINLTKESSKTLLPWIRGQRLSSLVRTPIPDEWYVTEEGQDVTDDFVTGPPGTPAPSPGSTAPPTTADPRTVFVIHGRDDKARDALFTFLRSIDLHPLEWSEALSATASPTPYVAHVLDKAFAIAQAVIVLMTPDDEARLRPHLCHPDDPNHERALTPQARPNVLFEAGMAMGRAPERTVLVELGLLRPFSDIAGRHVVRLDNSTQRRQELASRLKTCGCPVSLEGTDWHKAGTFAAG